MPNLSLKQKIITAVAIIGALLIFIFQQGLYSKSSNSDSNPQPSGNSKPQSSEPSIVSTNPSPLDEAIIFPSQTIEITFNTPLENSAEFKSKIEPKVEYKVELSEDRKTAKIIPEKPFPFGSGYTLFILSDTKFEGKKTLGKEIVVHFKTIDYQGI